MAYADFKAQLNADLSAAYAETAETWITDAGDGEEFAAMSAETRNDQDFQTLAQERTISERELRWQDTAMGSIPPRSRLYWQDDDSYWLTNDMPEHVLGEYIVQVRQVNISTRGAIQ